MADARCPYCSEDRLIEWDSILRRWVCAVCGRTWQMATARATRRLTRGVDRASPNCLSALTQQGAWCDPFEIARSPIGVRGSRRHRSWTHITRFGVTGISGCGRRHPGSRSHAFAVARLPTIVRGVTQDRRHAHLFGKALSPIVDRTLSLHGSCNLLKTKVIVESKMSLDGKGVSAS